MFKSKKYKKLEKDYETLNDDYEMCRGRIEYLTDKLQKQEKEYEEKLKHANSENISLRKSNTSLIDTNQKLNDWIEKILNEVGIKELHERTGITIPVYTENPVRAYDNNQFNNGDFLKRKEIIIPELRFIKMG